MGAHSLFLVVVVFLVASITSNAHNITEILSHFPEYSVYNSYLTQTKLADEINSRQTITCLVLNNDAMNALAQNRPLSVIKSVLELHTVLDYYDSQKLHDISDGTTLSTTLYQTTGNADGNFGFVNITDLKGGKVGFGSAAPGSKLDSTYTKTVKTVPYNISVIEISAPIISPGILNAPAPGVADVNITARLEEAACKTFASLIVSSGVLTTYQNAMDKGLTIFAPNDEAFKRAGAPDLGKLTSPQVVALLQYHAVAEYRPVGSLKTSRTPISTLASNGAGKYQLTTTTAGDEVNLHTGVDSSRLASTVIDDTPLCIFTVDNILLPVEIFGTSPSPSPDVSPVPAPVASPSPTPIVSPAPVPSTSAPSPEPLSPPATPTASPEGSPSEAPGPSEAENSRSTASAAADLKAPVVLSVAFLFSSLALMLSV